MKHGAQRLVLLLAERADPDLRPRAGRGGDRPRGRLAGRRQAEAGARGGEPDGDGGGGQGDRGARRAGAMSGGSETGDGGLGDPGAPAAGGAERGAARSTVRNTEPTAGAERTKEIARRFREDFWNSGDLTIADEIVAADCLFHARVPFATDF